MTEKTITIGDKEVGILYCYATEIAFSDYTDDSITNFIHTAATDFKEGRMPDVKKSAYLLVSAIVAYYQYHGGKPPVTDGDIIYSTSPKDFNNALAAVILLYEDFYSLPGKEKDDAKKDVEDGKKKSPPPATLTS